MTMQGNLSGMNFNPDNMEMPEDRFELIPVGWYAAIINDSDFGPNNANTGHNLKLAHEVTGPAQAGRLHFENLSLDNPNAEAVRIAGETLKKICAALGHVGPLTDSSALHDKPMLIHIGIKKNKRTGEQENVIKQWKPYDAEQLKAAAQAAPAPQANAAPPTGQAAPPATAAPQAAPQAAGEPPFGQAPPPF